MGAAAVNLTSNDFAKLAASGIPQELAEQAQLRRVDSREGGELVGRNGSGDYAGLVFPYLWPGETGPREYRLRRDHPDIEYKDGKPRDKNKYLAPPGRGNFLYLVPGTFSEWLADTNLPVVIVEGEKKCLALWVCAWDGLGDSAETPRFLPVGVSGVWNWRGAVGKAAGPDGDRRNVTGVIPDMRRIAWKGRKVTILYDTNVRGNPSVQAARSALTTELQKMGAVVSWFAWPDDTPEGINGIDDVVGLCGHERVRHLIVNRARPAKITAADRPTTREFVALGENHYCLKIPNLGITLDIDRVRRERSELVGELSVSCELPGARTFDGSTISVADFNLSSARARQDRAKLLAERSNTTGSKDLDWHSLLEELCVRTLKADRDGQPGIYLHEIPKPDTENQTVEIHGLILPRRHPSLIFGDGGAAKSYVGLYVAGTLAREGIPTALFDWELAGEDHRVRLERLFGNPMPRVLYVRCERPLIHEMDRLRRMVREKGIEFSIFDSVAYACNGAPEAAEVTSEYFRAVRQIGGGSLHIAHINKSENADQKPFGSIFWHNSARATWFAQRVDEVPDGSIIRIALHNRKTNLGPLRQPIGYTVTFTEDETIFRRAEVADHPELAKGLSVRQRMIHLLRKGAMPPDAIAEEIEADVETVRRTVRRYKNQFTVIDGGRVGLLERNAS
jgi:Domain of unknown function (DUF3854)